MLTQSSFVRDLSVKVMQRQSKPGKVYKVLGRKNARYKSCEKLEKDS